jgi:hypothetical protein
MHLLNEEEVQKSVDITAEVNTARVFMAKEQLDPVGLWPFAASQWNVKRPI